MTRIINYIYIYTPRPAQGRAGGMPPEVRDALDRLTEAAGGANMPPEIKKKIDKIRGLTAQILAIIDGIKSPALQQMLKQALNNVLTKAEGGNLDGAIQDLNTLVTTCERIADKLRKGQNMCSSLACNTIPGPAGNLLQTIGKVAEQALAACDSERKLDEINGLLEQSMEFMARLGTLKPTDDKYIEICKELKGILGRLSSMDRLDESGQEVGMGSDELLLALDMKDHVDELMQALLRKALPPGQAEHLKELEDQLKQLADHASKVGGENAKGKFNELMHLASTGKLGEALIQAREANEAIAQLARRKSYGEGLLVRLGEVRDRLKGPDGEKHPAAGTLEAVFQALEERLAAAESTEEVAQLEEALRMALQSARTLQSGVGGMERSQAARDLLQVALRLGVARKQDKDEAPQGPGWSADDWASSSASSASSGKGKAESSAPSKDPLAQVEVPPLLDAMRSEGQKLTASAWAAASSLEGELHDPVANAIQSLSQELAGASSEADGMESLRRLKALEQQLQQCKRAPEGSAEAKAAQDNLTTLVRAQTQASSDSSASSASSR